MTTFNLLGKIRVKISKLLSASLIVSMLPILVLGNLVGSSSAANANLVVDAANATFSFTTKSRISGSSGADIGKANGDVVLFSNVYTSPSGISIDAVVTTTITNVGSIADENVRISAYDNTNNNAEVNKYLELSVSGTNGSDFNGYINLNFKFYESGTYTGVGTGNPITLQNVSVFSLDVDSGNQFSDFKGFQKYYVNNPTRLRIDGTANPIPTTPTDLRAASPYFRFLSGVTAPDTNDPRDSVQVEYLTVTSLDARVGNATSAGGAYFAIGFGQWDWNGGTAELGTPNPVDNPVNTAPTSSDYSLYVPTTGNFVLEKRHFGSYADTDGNAFDKVQITQLPTSGTLQKLSSGSWVVVNVNDYILVSAIDAGDLRLVMNTTGGTIDTNMKFKVNDSLANSTTAYTLTLSAVPTPQTITFNNPGTKAVGAAAITDTATATSGLATSLVSLTTGICTITNGTITGTNTAGACTVTATQDGDSTYSAAPSVTQTFYYSNDTAQTITYATPSDIVLGSGAFTDTATTTSPLTVTLTSLSPSVCTVSGFVVTPVTAGTCQIRASQLGGTSGGVTYAPASPITRSFNISAGTAQTIDFAQPAAKFVSDTFASGATASPSGLPVTLTSSTPSVCTVSGLNITTVAEGTCTIVASQAGENTYAAASNVSRTFNVAVRPVVVVIPTNVIYFNLNSGTGYMNPQYAYSNSTAVLERNLYKKDGYTFTGWNTKADGTGTAYADGSLLALSFADVVLYAQWKLIQTKPTITWATPLAIQEGIPLSPTQLNALASVPGTYTYSPAAPTLLAPGKHILKVRFVPTEAKYETVETTVEIEVLAKATITWRNPASIDDVTALSATQLNALGSVPGTYSYSPATGTLLPAGKNILKVIFTPTDTRLSAVSAEVTIDVTQVVPSAPVSPTYSVTGYPKTTISWAAGANAATYTVTLDGKSACAVAVLTCDVAKLLGPKNVINVTSVAASGKTSAAVRANYAAPATTLSLTSVNFDTARSVIKKTEATKLRTFANAVKAAGFTTLTVHGHTDPVPGVDNQKLSIARSKSTIAYLKRLLPGVRFKLGGFAAEEPIADNSTVQGKAANRRAEVLLP